MQGPQSIGVIMDGNRRWARAQGRSISDGHLAGARRAGDVARWAASYNVAHVCLYALSTENWNRAPLEVEHLLLLIELFFRTQATSLASEGMRIKVVGQRERFPKRLREIFEDIERRTEAHTGTTVWVALSYGGRAEILEGILKVQREKVLPTEAVLKEALWTSSLPDPDLIIRTGGEKRLSNFLTWGSVYSELFFTDTLWPAFTREEFDAILDAYAARDRRRGT